MSACGQNALSRGPSDGKKRQTTRFCKGFPTRSSFIIRRNRRLSNGIFSPTPREFCRNAARAQFHCGELWKDPPETAALSLYIYTVFTLLPTEDALRTRGFFVMLSGKRPGKTRLYKFFRHAAGGCKNLICPSLDNSSAPYYNR